MAQALGEAEILKLFGNHDVLRLLPAETVRGLVRRAALLTYAQRDEIFGQGGLGRTVMVVVSGYVKLWATLLNGREVVLDLAEPGSLIGEIAVLSDSPRAAAATALSACSLLAIDGSSFTRALATAPEAMFAIFRLLSRRLRRTTAQVTDSVELPATVRLAKALLELAALSSRPTTEGLEIELSLSQSELGGMTGSLRESINRHLSAWRDLGWIQLTERTMTLTDVDALRRLLHGNDVV